MNYYDPEGILHVPIGVIEFVYNSDLPEKSNGKPIIYQIKKTDITNELKTIYDCIHSKYNNDIIYMPFSSHHLCIFRYPKNNGKYGYYLAGNAHFFMKKNNQICSNIPNNALSIDSEISCKTDLCNHIEKHLNICKNPNNQCFVDENERTCNTTTNDIEYRVIKFLNLESYDKEWDYIEPGYNFPINKLFHETNQLYNQYNQFIHYYLKLFANISFYFFIYASNRINDPTNLIEYLYFNDNQFYYFDNESSSDDILDPKSFIKIINILFSDINLNTDSQITLQNFELIETIYNSSNNMTPIIEQLYEKLQDTSSILTKFEGSEHDIPNMFMTRIIKQVIRNKPHLLEPDPDIINNIIELLSE